MDIKEMNVWGLTQAIYDIIENGFSYDEETGEVYFTADDLDTLNETLDKKINGICGFIKFADSKLNSLKERKKEIDATIKFYSKKQERLEAFLKNYLEMNNITSTKDVGDYRVGFRKSKSLNITDEQQVYDYLEKNPTLKQNCIKTTYALSKTDIKGYLDEGVEIPGVAIVENKNVTIK